MTTYLLLLRGINVGGHKKVPMSDLKKMLSEMGCKNSKTFLNSGNVVFEAKEEKEKELKEKIAKKLEKTFGFEIPVLLRSKPEIEDILKKDPFGKIKADKDMRLYVSFLPKKTKSDLKLPFVAKEQDFKIIQKTDREIFSVLNLKNGRSVDAMKVLEKEYGKDITTRNWNTVLKVAQNLI